MMRSVLKTYILRVVQAYLSDNTSLPDMYGHAGATLMTDGTVAYWADPTVAGDSMDFGTVTTPANNLDFQTITTPGTAEFEGGSIV